MHSAKAPLFHVYSRRLHLLLLLVFGIFNNQYMNTNLAIAMTCMVNYTAIHQEQFSDSNATESLDSNWTSADSCGARAANNDAKPAVVDYGGSLIWDNSVQNLLFSAAFWGGVAAMIPSIFICQKFSPKWVFLTAISVKAVCTSVIPFLAYRFGFYAVFVARFILGLAEPFIFPPANTMISKWFPMDERSTAVAMFTTGNQIASFAGNPITASFCSSSMGWPVAFYFPAVLGLSFLVLWVLFAANEPSEVKMMSTRERQYLIENAAVKHEEKGKKYKVVTPWRAIFTNKPYLSHLFSTFVLCIVITFFLTYLPTYFKDVLMLGVMMNGTFTSLPMMFNFSFKLFWGFTVDLLKQKHILTPTQAVKLSQCYPTFGVAVPLILVICFVNCSVPYLALALLCMANMFLGAHTSGAYTSMLSLAPVYTPTLSAITGSVSMIAQATTPFIVGFFKKSGTVAEWNTVILVVIVLCIMSGVQFLIYGSGDVQDFGLIEEHSDGVTLQVPNRRDSLSLSMREVRVASLRAESISML